MKKAKKHPTLPFSVEHFLIGVKLFTTEEVGAYMLLLCEQWHKGFVENDDKILKKITGISPKKLIKVLEKFEKKEHLLINKRLDTDRIKKLKLLSKSSEGGKSSAKKRSEQAVNQMSKQTVKQMSKQTVDQTSNQTSTQTTPPIPPKDTKTNSMVSEFRVIFEKFYLEKTNEKYYWTAKDAARCLSLKNKLVFKIKEKKSRSTPNTTVTIDSVDSTDEIKTAFEYLLSIIKDQWILTNLSISIIDQKFNEIIANKNVIKPKSASTDRQERTDSVSKFKELAETILDNHQPQNGSGGV